MCQDATAAAAAAHKSILPANLMWEFCIGYIVRPARLRFCIDDSSHNSQSFDRTKPQEGAVGPPSESKTPVQKKAAFVNSHCMGAVDAVSGFKTLHRSTRRLKGL